MTPSLRRLAELMQIEGLADYYDDPKAMMAQRDAIKAIIAEAVKQRSTGDWLAILQPADIGALKCWTGRACSKAKPSRALTFISSFAAAMTSHSTPCVPHSH